MNNSYGSRRPPLEESRVRELADGRVFSGKQAFEAGLVDELEVMLGSQPAL